MREISKNTLVKSPLFEALFNEKHNLDNFFIDRDADLFDEMIAYIAWDIPPSTQQVIDELDHYAIVLSEDNDEISNADEFSSTLAEQIMSDNAFLDGAFYISACGKVYVTTRRRLTRIGYFRGVFNEDVQMKMLYKGTKDDPYRTEVPASVMENLINHLRDSRNELMRTTLAILDVLGGIKGEKKDDDDEATEENYDEGLKPGLINSTSDVTSALFELVANGVQNVYLDADWNNARSEFQLPGNHVNDERTLDQRIKALEDKIKAKTNQTMWKKPIFRTTKHYTMRRSIVASGTKLHYKANVSREGNLINQMYIKLHYKFKEKPYDVRQMAKNDPLFFFKAIDQIDIEIGGQTIEKMTGYQLMLLDGMRLDKRQTMDGFALIHVPTFFCTESYNALPLIALQYHEVNINIRMYSVLHNIDIVPEVLLTYVFLSRDERQFFACNDHEYRHLLYDTPDTFVIKDDNQFRCRLLINHPTNAIFFTLHENDSVESMFRPLVGCLESYKFQLNGHNRCIGDEEICILDKIDANINRNSPVYVIPFAQKPLDSANHTRTLNLSRIDNFCLLYVKASKKVGCVRVWTNYWNVLRVTRGMAALAFAN